MSTAELAVGLVGHAIDARIRIHLDARHHILDRAARLRATAWEVEDRVRECEETIAASPPRGRRWKTLRDACTRAVATAASVTLGVLHEEENAHPHLLTAIGQTGAGEAATRAALLTIRRLREEVIGRLERALAVSRRVTDLPARTGPEDVAALLADRRRFLSDAEVFRREADALERRTLLDPAGSRALPGLAPSSPDFPVHEDPDPTPRAKPEVEEFESWLLSLQDGPLPEEESGEGGPVPGAPAEERIPDPAGRDDGAPPAPETPARDGEALLREEVDRLRRALRRQQAALRALRRGGRERRPVRRRGRAVGRRL